jgi:DNA-binding transcriptional LysR family regulator
MTSWPNLTAWELFVAVVDEGSLGAGARKVGMAQPNASRLVAGLEAAAGTPLLDRTPRGSVPTTAGVALAERAREVLASARHFNDLVLAGGDGGPALELRVGASMTIAECLLPVWLTELHRRMPRVRVDLRVLNSEQVMDAVRDGSVQLGFVETPQPPVRPHGAVVHQDELVVVVAPAHPWAGRRTKVGLPELARTPLVVREPGSGTRETLDELLADLDPVAPAQVLHSNAAVRIAVAAGEAPAALSRLAVRHALARGELLQVPLTERVTRPLTAIWSGPRRLTGAAAELVTLARDTPAW